MAKQKITVTVDEELVEAVRSHSQDTLSSVVNAALAREIERRGRQVALGRFVAEWEAADGLIPEDLASQARRAFDDADAGAQHGAA